MNTQQHLFMGLSSMTSKETLNERADNNRIKNIKQRARNNYFFYLRVRSMFDRTNWVTSDSQINAISGINIPKPLKRWIYELQCKYLDCYTSEPDKFIGCWYNKRLYEYYVDDLSIELKQEYK